MTFIDLMPIESGSTVGGSGLLGLVGCVCVEKVAGHHLPCPTLLTEEDHRNLIGRKVLIAHERTKTLEPTAGTLARSSSLASPTCALRGIEPMKSASMLTHG